MRALTLALIVTTTLGCGSKTETAGNHATGNTEAANANHEAAKVAREIDDKATEVVQAQGAAQATAATANAAAESVLATARDGARDKLQKAFDASDRRFNMLKETAATVTGAKKTDADAAAADITTREATVMAGIAKLQQATGPAWDTLKTQADADAAALDNSINALEFILK